MSFHPESLVAEPANRDRWLRAKVMKTIRRAGSGHPGGSLSTAEIVATRYFHQLRLDLAHPDWLEQSRSSLSKGHAAPMLYASLAHRGFSPQRNRPPYVSWTAICRGIPIG